MHPHATTRDALTITSPRACQQLDHHATQPVRRNPCAVVVPRTFAHRTRSFGVVVHVVCFRALSCALEGVGKVSSIELMVKSYHQALESSVLRIVARRGCPS